MYSKLFDIKSLIQLPSFSKVSVAGKVGVTPSRVMDEPKCNVYFSETNRFESFDWDTEVEVLIYGTSYIPTTSIVEK
jgi:hypothetical protein